MAGLTLAMDAAAGVGTIAVLADGALVAERTVAMRSEEEERFFPAVLEALGAVGGSPRELHRIICGAGPGSFTSLRVVGACAKGLAFGGAVPLYGVPSLALIVAAHAGTHAGTHTGTHAGTHAGARSGRWLASLDAMRGDRYLALVTVGSDGALASVEALGLAPAAEVAARAEALDATVIGPGESIDASPHARGVVRCLALIEAAGPAPLAGWEPVYGRLAEAQVKWEAAQGRPLRG